MKAQGRGFTLIEIIISLSILAVGLVGILSLFPIGFDSARRSVDSTQAAVFAHEKLEQLRSSGFPAVGTTNGTFTDPIYGWTQTVTDGTPAGYLRKVDLTVSWTYRNKSYQRTFTTYVAAR